MLNFDKFIEKDEIGRIEELKEFWRLKENILVGKIAPLKNEEQKYRFIEDIKDIQGNYIEHPFIAYKNVSAYCGDSDNKERNNFIKSLNENEQVLFKFMINRTSNEKIESSPIAVDVSNIFRLKDIEDLASEKESDLIKVIKEAMIKDPYIERVVFQEDFEEELCNLIEEVENNLKEYKLKINDKSNELVTIENDILEKSKLEEELTNKISNKQDKLDNINKALSHLGFIENTYESQIDTNNFKCDLERKDHIEYIKKYLGVNYQKNLYYSEEILEQFYGALCTNQLLILSGSPGTGKTSLVEGFSEAIGSNLKVIAVQPNWTDNQDLLGFYNPIEKTYVSTPFLDAVIEAQENSEKLYIICLDEMNLAQVEFYFSEFLSKLQSVERTIELYSDYIYKQTKNELINKICDLTGIDLNKNDLDSSDKLNKINIKDKEYFYKLKWQWNFINRYPAKIKIPKNIRFVGTINKDETTKDLSPKVIDRSYIMEIASYDKEIEKDMKMFKKKYEDTYSQRLFLKADNFQFIKQDIPDEINKRLIKIEECLYDIGVPLNNRFYDQVREYIGANIYEKSNILDNIVSTKILPKININLSDDENDKLYRFISLINDLPISRDKFRSMIEFWNTYKILSFWR
ncbi:McrB family protein [uncultured Clostridium sp.]|uniref:McrB family protein n=1 Tax=uncultured Clostridium sp. TaxID=59620 RepID=UPI0026703C76|nr:AAA family ATPase [uncultured Clostridium sp.]